MIKRCVTWCECNSPAYPDGQVDWSGVTVRRRHVDNTSKQLVELDHSRTYGFCDTYVSRTSYLRDWLYPNT